MAIGMIDDSTLYDIGDAIREKNGSTIEYLPSEMPDAIRSIEAGVELPALTNPATAADLMLDKQLIDGNGNIITGNIPEFSGDKVAVANLSELYHINNFVRVTGITSLNSRYDGLLLRHGTQQRIFVPDDQFGDADAGDVAKGKTFTSAAGLLVEGTHECDEGVTLPTLEFPGDENDLLEGVQLIGQGGSIVNGTIPKKTVDNITVDGRTITVPAGYYESNSIKSVDTVTLSQPTISIDAAGKITASVTQSSGYVSSSTKSATKQLAVQEAQTITPGTSDKTIGSGKYLTGTQTIKGDSNLIAGNIKNGVTIFGVTGTYEESSGYSSGDVVKAQAASAVLASGYSSLNAVYANGVTVTNGAVALSGTTTTFSISDTSSFDNAKGKYVKATSGTIYYLPEDATITNTGSTYSKSYTADKANMMFILA